MNYKCKFCNKKLATLNNVYYRCDFCESINYESKYAIVVREGIIENESFMFTELNVVIVKWIDNGILKSKILSYWWDGSACLEYSDVHDASTFLDLLENPNDSRLIDKINLWKTFV